jgi:hypothetical protein
MFYGVDDLTAVVSLALREHDPLDPWLTESHWDDAYWSGEASAIAARLAPGMDADSVRAIVVEALGDLLGGSADPAEQSRQLDVIAQSIAAKLGSA